MEKNLPHAATRSWLPVCLLLAFAVESGLARAASRWQPLSANSLKGVVGSEKSGRLSGRVRVEDVPSPLPPLQVYKHTQFCGSRVPDESLLVNRHGELENVVVTVHAVDAQKNRLAMPLREITLDNKDCRFVPHVQAAQLGTTLLLLNSDAILHDAYAFIGADTVFNEGLPTWRKVRKTLARAGVVRILCELHRAWMSAYIVVTTTPYFAVTDHEGGFVIDGLPVGAYSVRFWHERLGQLSGSVVVEPARTSTVEISFP
jgi:plastocyanin